MGDNVDKGLGVVSGFMPGVFAVLDEELFFCGGLGLGIGQDGFCGEFCEGLIWGEEKIIADFFGVAVEDADVVEAVSPGGVGFGGPDDGAIVLEEGLVGVVDVGEELLDGMFEGGVR